MYSLFCQLDHFVKEISFLKWPSSKERVSKFTLTFLYSIIIERFFYKIESVGRNLSNFRGEFKAFLYKHTIDKKV